jgi:tetratricopeptide (TPR) repeat protein
MPPAHKTRRRWYQFGLRTMFLVATTAVLASIGCHRAADQPPVAIDADLGDAVALRAHVEDLYRQERFAEALGPAKKLLEIQEGGRDPGDPEVGRSQFFLASVYHALGQDDACARLLLRAIDNSTTSKGENHPTVAMCYSLQGDIARKQGAYAEAEHLFRKANAIFESTVGPNHEVTVANLSNLAASCAMQQKYSEAEPLFLRALAVQEKVLGPNSVDVAVTLERIANMYSAQGNFEESAALQRRVNSIRAKNSPAQ